MSASTDQEPRRPDRHLVFHTLGQLLEQAQHDDGRLPGLFGYPAQLRLRYCQVATMPAADRGPCAACGTAAATLVDGVPLHLGCPDPDQATLARFRVTAEPPAPSNSAAADLAQAGPGPVPPPLAGQLRRSGPAAAAVPSRSTAPPADTPASPAPAASASRPLRGRTRAEAATAAATDRWRAPAAVVHADGVYLPGGEKLPLPPEVPHIGILASLPARLQLGWGGGALPPAPGQLWLTGAFLHRAGLPAELPEGIEDRDELLAQAATHPFITGAAAAGWQISEASRTRLGHRMRIWSTGDRAGAQIVFVPYISSLIHLLDGDPDPAALAQRLDLYARQIGVPYARSAAYSGHDLLTQIDARRKLVVTGPADPPPVRCAAEGSMSFQRAPTDAELKLPFVHSYDMTRQWLAAALRTKLGLGAATHVDSPQFDPKLPGMWRITPPAWDSPLPSPFTGRRPEADGTVWLPTSKVALAVDPNCFGLDIRPAEAWVWHEHTQYLDLWVDQLNKAALALAQLAGTGDSDAAAVLEALKDTYSGAITLFGSQQLDADETTGRPRDKFFRPYWSYEVISGSAPSRLWRKILQVETCNRGRWPLAIDRDNLLYASGNPDPVAACPEPLRIGNQLGHVKHKGSALMSVAAKPLQRGRFDFGRLISPHEWDPQHGGPRAAAGDPAGE